MEITLGEHVGQMGLLQTPGGCKAADWRNGGREGLRMEDKTLVCAIRLELQRNENRATCSRRSSMTRETGMVRQRRAERVRIDGEVSGGYSRKIGERNAKEFSSASEEICRARAHREK